MLKRLAGVLAVGIVIGVLAWKLRPMHSTAARSTQPTAKVARGARDRSAVVPVVLAPVRKQALPVYLDGLGTVQAYNTATVRAQVSGQLISVPFKEGDEVKKGDLLAQIDPRTFQATLDEAQGKLAQDRATLRSAQQDLKRYEALAPQGYVSGQQLDQQRQTVEGDAALVKSDAAAVESDRVQLSYTNITAPISGRLGIRQIDVGNLVSSGDSTGIVTITQTQPIAVMFTLPEQTVAQLRAGGGAPMPVEALDRNNSRKLTSGQLAVISNQIDQNTGTIQLKAVFPNTDETLWPGQFVNVQLLASTLHDALVVPVAAVQRGPSGAYVYVVGTDRSARLVTVHTGDTVGDLVQIVDGLKVGDQVVIDGAYQLMPGSKVKVLPASQAPASAASGVAPASAG